MMAAEVDGKDALRFVVEPGHRVRAEGRFVHTGNADWLDMARVSDLIARPESWMSHRSVRLLDADGAAVPISASTDPSLMPRWLCVVGVWRDEAIRVEAHTTERPELPAMEGRFGLPPPAEGWDLTQRSRDVQGLDELRAAGTIVQDGWLRDESGASLLRVAASDVEAVVRVMGPQLPRRLYVVPSRYTAAQLRDVRETFKAHAMEWGFEVWSSEGMTAECQPYADVVLTRVTEDLAAWAASLPAGLLTLHPAMTPA